VLAGGRLIESKGGPDAMGESVGVGPGDAFQLLAVVDGCVAAVFP